MRDVSDDTDPFVTAPCEGIAPGGWQCMNLIQEDGHLLEEIEEHYGFLLCGDCQDDADNGNTPVDEEARKEAAWEFQMDR